MLRGGELRERGIELRAESLELVFTRVRVKRSRLDLEWPKERAISREPQAERDCAVLRDAYDVGALACATAKARQRLPDRDGDFLTKVVAIHRVLGEMANDSFDVGRMGRQ